MNKYCVYLTLYRGNLLPPFYIGSTSISKIENGYRGSPTSKEYKHVWNQERKENPNLFKTIIIYTCSTREEASIKETTIQYKLKVHTNILYINKAIWKGNHLNYRGNHTLESRLLMSKRMKGRKLGARSEEVKRKISESKRNNPYKPTQEYRDKMSKLHKGRVVSDKTRIKLSECSKRRLGMKQTQTHIDAARKAKIKYKWIITENDQTIVITDLKKWCEDRNILQTNAREGFIRRGKYKEYTGYREQI